MVNKLNISNEKIRKQWDAYDKMLEELKHPTNKMAQETLREKEGRPKLKSFGRSN